MVADISSLDTHTHTHTLMVILHRCVMSSLQLKVTHKQLVLLHNAFAAYFSGNHSAMEELVAELQARLEEQAAPATDPPAWLEQMPSSQRN